MSTQYDLYLKSVMRLTATIVLKDEATCDVINSYLSLRGYAVDKLNPRSWKYYMNLAGQYHATNETMYIISMDTAEEIEFTVANLDIHRKTWREYQYGSRYYNELVEKYPKQQMLIDGILNPVDIDTAIAADDHSILYYDPTLVETRESNLILVLQNWINGIFIRWDNNDYRINNSLFVAARLLILFMAMPLTILNIRLANCHTHMAHSFHIRRYLASFGPLDDYYTAMNEFQRLYFYRNIRYLMRNNGQRDIFRELIQNVLTERGFPLAEYLIQQNDSSIPETVDPITQFMRLSVNGLPAALGEDVKTTVQMLELENSLTKGNPEEALYAAEYIPAAMETNLYSQANTKVLESNVLDLTESEPYTISEVLMNHWPYLADKGLYYAVVTLTLPDGGEDIKLSMKDAYILYLYAYCLRAGFTLPEIPRIEAKRVRRMPLPTAAELRDIASYQYVDQAFITEALKDNVEITRYASVDSFLEVCTLIQARMLRHRDLYVYRNNVYTYGELKQMTDRFYADVPLDLGAGTNYADWLRERNLVLDQYSMDQLDEIVVSLVNQAIGADLQVVQDMKVIHRSMLDIMSQLSSYSVQYIQQINQDAIVMIDNPHLRWNDLGSTGGDSLRLPLTPVGPEDLQAKGKEYFVQSLDNVHIQSLDSYTGHQVEMDLGLEFELSGLNQRLEQGITLANQYHQIVEDTKDLSTLLTGQQLTSYEPLVNRPIAELFQKVSTDEFYAP